MFTLGGQNSRELLLSASRCREGRKAGAPAVRANILDDLLVEVELDPVKRCLSVLSMGGRSIIRDGCAERDTT